MRQTSWNQLALIGLGTVVATAVAVYLAFGGALPWTSEYTVRAEMRNPGQLHPRAPVRIAGVTVGEVTSIEPRGGGRPGAVVTLRIDPSGRPIHTDAEIKARPRTALEGNEFVDLRPGSPSAPRLDSGGTIPVSQTSASVQLDQVLGTLDNSTRRRLVTAIDEYGLALGGRGGRGFNGSIPYWERAYRGSARINQAMLGRRLTDLSDFVDSSGTVADAIDSRPQALRTLIARFDQTTGALAAERSALAAGVHELPATLATARGALGDVERTLPALDRLAARLTPTVRATRPTIDALRPLLVELRGLARPAELQGLADDLRPAIVSLARVSDRSPDLLRELRLASSCQDRVILPWSRESVDDAQFPATGPVYEEFIRGALPGLSGESRSGDANGQWFTPAAVAGTNVIDLGQGRFGTTGLPALGVNPQQPDQRPPLRPNVPCETQRPPDLRSVASEPPRQFQIGLETPEAVERFGKARARALDWLRDQVDADDLPYRVSGDDLTLPQLRSLRPPTPAGVDGAIKERP